MSKNQTCYSTHILAYHSYFKLIYNFLTENGLSVTSDHPQVSPVTSEHLQVSPDVHSPVVPWGPGLPVPPVIPTRPVAPVSPRFPLSPWNPLSPRWPVAPVSPIGPNLPETFSVRFKKLN